MGLISGDRTYSKSLLKLGKTEYREWDPTKSKPAAAIMKGLKKLPVKKNSKILYLGIASGATAIFFSDIIGNKGMHRGPLAFLYFLRFQQNIAGPAVHWRSLKFLRYISLLPPDIYFEVELVAEKIRTEIVARKIEPFEKPGSAIGIENEMLVRQVIVRSLGVVLCVFNLYRHGNR